MEIMSIDISNATLDIIEAVKNKQTIKFDYQYLVKNTSNKDNLFIKKILNLVKLHF